MSDREFSLVVAYGTDMGNAEDAAMSFAEATTAAGIPAEAVELNQVELDHLSATTHFIAVTSTFGDGEFPDTATLFWEAISASTERLEHMSFAVLALGDTSYELFCNAGNSWTPDSKSSVRPGWPTGSTSTAATRKPLPPGPPTSSSSSPRRQSRYCPTRNGRRAIESPRPTPSATGPFAAPLTVNRLLTSAESDKEVRHYELDLSGSGITYQAGDSLAVHPTNDPELVAAILTELNIGPEYRVAGCG